MLFDIAEGGGEGEVRAILIAGRALDPNPLSALNLDVPADGGGCAWSPVDAEEMLVGDANERSRSLTYCGPMRGLMGWVAEVSTLGLGETALRVKGACGGWRGDGVRSVGGGGLTLNISASNSRDTSRAAAALSDFSSFTETSSPEG